MINPLIKEGFLPHFKNIIDNGFVAELKETIPPVTIPSWPCLFSGLTPYQLGFYWFMHPRKGLFNSNFWREDAIFSCLPIKSFVMNVPGTYPAWKINGEMITGMLSPKFSCYPRELENAYKDKWIIDGNNIHDIFKAFHIKKRIFLKKLEEDFDLLTFVIRMPDAISHHAHQGIEKTLAIIKLSYRAIDNFLGEILRNNSFDNLFIISDHGLKYYKKEFNLLRWLGKKGFINLDEPKQKLLKSVMAKFFNIIRPFIKTDFSYKLEKLEKKFSKTKGEDIYRKLGSEFSVAKLNHTDVQKYSSNVGGLFLSRDDKLKLEYINQELKKDKNIEKVIAPKVEYFPDLFIILKNDFIFSEEPSFFVVRKRSEINHIGEGIFVAYGKKIKKEKRDIVNFFDFVPTILKIFNIKKPENLIGKSLDIIKEL